MTAAPTLVLLPGLACAGWLWEAQRPALPAALNPRVSDAHTRHDSIEAMAAAVLAEHAGPLLLCGASMGGMVAMEAVRRAPARIAGLALLGTTAAPETPEMHQLRAAAIEVFERGRPEELRALIASNAPFAFHPAQAADRALVAHYVERVVEAGAGQLIRQNRAVMRRPDARAHLPGYRGPALLLCGEADQLTPPAAMREIAALLPQAELHWLRDCGHMLTLEQPTEVNALLGGWLRRRI